MLLEKNRIADFNGLHAADHKRKFDFVSSEINNVEEVLQKLIDFQVAIPSWALGTGGTRFGRFAGAGEPGNLEQKLEDVGLLHALNQSSGAISLHIPWDIPENYLCPPRRPIYCAKHIIRSCRFTRPPETETPADATTR